MKLLFSGKMQERLWTKDYVIVILISLFSSFSFNMISSLLTKYLLKIGTTVSIAGIIVGVFSITALFARPFAGVMADHYDKKKLAVVTTVILGVCMLGYTISPNLVVIVIIRIVHAVAFGMSGTALASLVVDYIPEKRMGEGIGYFGFGQILGTAVAPGIGISISNLLGMEYAFYISSALGIAGGLLLLVSRIKKVPHSGLKEKPKLSLGNIVAKEAVNVTILGGIIAVMSGSVSSFLLVLGDSVGISNVSIYFTISAFVMLAVRPFAGKMMDRKGLAKLLYPALLFGIIGMVVLGNATTLILFIVSAVFRALSQGIGFPSLQAEAVRKTGKARSGLANSTFMVGADLGNGVGPIIGGYIAGIFNYQAVYYWCAILLAAGIFIFFITEKMARTRITGIA